jgi:hypothetical protein
MSLLVNAGVATGPAVQAARPFFVESLHQEERQHMASFIHVNDINVKEGLGGPGQWVNTNAIDILESANNGQDTDMTLRSGRVIRMVGALDSWKDNISKAAAGG